MKRKPQTAQSLSDVVQTWLLSKQHASIEGIDLRPSENSLLKNNPLVIARGQAQAYFLYDSSRRVWILKKFLPGRKPDASYLNGIRALIPQEPGFESGYQRRMVYALSDSPGAFDMPDFAAWIEGTILMPVVPGTDWAYIADQVRAGSLRLDLKQRLSLCRSLSAKIESLEKNGLAHRDLSSTNIFVDTKTWEVHLIDWDSLYHSSLSIPGNTTFGTNGYVAPFIKTNGAEDPRLTWRDCADRFSLAILNSEFLCVDKNSPVTGDGGLFEQEQIYRRGGPGIDKILAIVEKSSPSAAQCLRKALHASGFDTCPQPHDWISLSKGVAAPSLKDVYDPQADFLFFLQEEQKRRSQQKTIPAPSLKDVELPDLNAAASVTRKKIAAPPAPSLTDVETLEWNSLPLVSKPTLKKTS